MAESHFVSLRVPEGPGNELSLVESVPKSVLDIVSQLSGADGDAYINADELSNTRPDSSPVGLQVQGVLLDMRVITTRDGASMAMVRVLIVDPIDRAVQALDANRAGESSLVYVGRRRAFARVDARYRLKPEDTAAIKAAGVKLSATRKNGIVSVGVTALYTGMVLSFSMYKVGEFQCGGAAVTAGALMKFSGVQFSLDWNGSALSEHPMCNAARYVVLKNDDENAARLNRAMDEACVVPPFTADNDPLTLDVWPDGMLVVRDELPAASRNIAPMDTGSASALPRIEGPPGTEDSASAHAHLVVPDRPRVYMSKSEFVLHVGETRAQTAVRLSIAGQLGTPTMVPHPVLSTDKDAIKYQNQEQKDCVRAKFALFGSQLLDGRGRVPFVVHCTVPMGPAIQMLTGIVSTVGQEFVLPALIAQLTGPLLVEPCAAGEAEINGEIVRVFTSFISTIPPRVLELTIPLAGFEVSPAFMLVERAIATRPNIATESAKAAAECAYYRVAGTPSLASNALALGATPMGCYDEPSTARLMGVLTRAMLEKSQDAQRAAVRPLIPELTGPIVQVAKTHAMYVVGRIVPTVDVVEHQQKLRDTAEVKVDGRTMTGREALWLGNEQLMLTGVAPAHFPAEIYVAAIEKSPPVPPRFSHYAIKANIASGEVVLARMRRQLEAANDGAKRQAIGSRNADEEVD